jgi:hypothetical protein
MSQFQSYYAAIRQHTESLSKQCPDNAVLVVSVSAPGSRATGGTVCEVSVPLAAKLVVEGSHGIASEAQAHAFRATMEMNRVRGPLVDTLENARAQFAALMAGKDKSK